ncbi:MULTISPECIES: GNAT family N-acetyltransferase [Rhizobium]|uniref:N-acetyltransferase n=1 Tax=Rhizobium dioscoreae TaxID=2653122 RepID=A0ABQ0YXK7_9HYPH|nr:MULTISPECIES: GNAT family N-acetyltransferase [Rhizobium]MCZ3377686.1 GNAT family N-acetyltransferase [Rhizobium sp. AG207R]GES47952.1 N-acetyltransferase [Rhizobium dioscoreae]GLU79580.1 N-acetyltransferase [Rhizobium sp. NBRC 114257]
MAIEIRPAVDGDLSGIARVVVDVWRATFAGLLPEDFLKGMSYRHQEQRHRRYLGHAGIAYYVAEDEKGEVVGFASGGSSRHSGFPQEAEVYALYLLPRYQRRKIGSALFTKVARALKDMEHKGLLALALENNPNRGFYERLRGRSVATGSLTFGETAIGQIAYVWDDLPALIESLQSQAE